MCILGIWGLSPLRLQRFGKGLFFRDKQKDAGDIFFCIYIHTYKLEIYLKIALTNLIQSVG